MRKEDWRWGKVRSSVFFPGVSASQASMRRMFINGGTQHVLRLEVWAF